MDREIAKLVEAFRNELDGCHHYLDEAGCPRSIGDRILTLKERIHVLVLADKLQVAVLVDELTPPGEPG